MSNNQERRSDGFPLALFLGNAQMADQVTKWDQVVPGLGVRVNTSGASVYVLKYRFNKKQRLVTLCSTKLITWDEARNIAIQVKFLLKQDTDPLPKLAELLPGPRKVDSVSMRFDKFAELYLERHARAHNKTWRDDERRINKYLLPKLGKKHLHEITKADISELHYEIGQTARYQANRVKELLHSMFARAADWSFAPTTLANPASGIKGFREKPRSKYLTKEQLEILAPAINAVKSPVKRNLFWLLLLTGCRLNELQKLEWSAVDLKRREFTAYDTKNDSDLVQPMTEAIYQLFQEIKDLNLSNQWVFFSERTGGHYKKLQSTWYGILKRSGLELRVHDLRRTNGSWLAQDGYSLHLISKVLNQTSAHVTARYAQHEKSDVLKALQSVSDIAAPFISSKTPPNDSATGDS